MGKEHQQVFGIKELYRPKQEPEVDIVAVHGLNGSSVKSWTSESGDSCWLNHPNFLPKYVDRGRVLTWGYNANISTLTRKTTSSDRILQHAQTLIAELHADRAALAYSASRSAPNISHLQSIYNCTFAILFFGTPHHGSSKANLLSSLTKIASLALPSAAGQIESGLTKAIKIESETLQNVTDQFAPLMSRFRTFFFWEQEKTDLKYTKDYIVEESSAAPILDNTERCGIAADHRGMIRFDSSTSQGFRTVVAALKMYTREAPQVIGIRLNFAAEMLLAVRQNEAMELMSAVQSPFADGLSGLDRSDNAAPTRNHATAPMVSTTEAPLHCENWLLENSGRGDSLRQGSQHYATVETAVDEDNVKKDESEDSCGPGREARARIDDIGGDRGKKEQRGKFVGLSLKWTQSLRGSARRN